MPEIERQLRILEALERDPNTTQARLAAQFGVAVGSVDWYLRRLICKGYVKATRMERRRPKCLVTPRGLALKARLTSQYVEVSLRVYRELRQAARETLAQVHSKGYTAVRAVGKDEVMEIFRLTCLEEGVRVEKDQAAAVPEVRLENTEFVVVWPGVREAPESSVE